MNSCGTTGSKSANTFNCVSTVSREFMSRWYLPLQKKVFSSFFTCKPARSTPLDANRSMCSCGKSPPTTDTKWLLGTKWLALNPM